MGRHRVILVLLLLGASVAGAADRNLSLEQSLTLEQAVATALANSPAVQAAKARADAAVSRSRQARGFRLPSVDLLQSFLRTDSPAEAFALQLNQERFDMMEFFSSDPNQPDALDTWMTRLEVTQPVYTGGKLSARIEQAELQATAEELQWRHRRQEISFAVTEAFINLAKAREYEQLLQRSRQTTAEHLQLAEQYAAQGMIVQAEVLNARMHLASMDEQLSQAATGAQLAEAALGFHMGADQSINYQLAALPRPQPLTGSLESWIAAALDRRHDLAAARRQAEAGRLEQRVARAAFKPEVAVVGRFDLYDDTPLGSHGSSSALMAVATINLFRGGADQAALAATRLESESHERDIDHFSAGVRLEVRQAWQKISNATSRQATAAASLDSAKEALRVREHRFKQGLDKMIDLLDAETALHEAEVRELVARYDLALATARLHFVSGAALTGSAPR